MKRKMGRAIGVTLAALLLLSVRGVVQAQRPCSIQGAVVTGSGRPAASVWVVLSQGNQERARGLTGDDGRYYLGGLERGSYTIAVKRGETRLFEGSVTLRADERYDIPVP